MHVYSILLDYSKNYNFFNVMILLPQYICLGYIEHVFLFPVKVDTIYTYLALQCNLHQEYRNREVMYNVRDPVTCLLHIHG